MLFNSVAYAFFLPIIFLFYWFLPHKYRWVLLLVASYYFYMSWNPKYVILIILTTLISYFCGIQINKAKTKNEKKLYLICTLCASLGVLFFFKYFNFTVESISKVMSIFAITPNPVTVKLLLPVGISFYTFQTLAYVIDVYRGDIEPENHLGIYATFISFFPQLVAGPIERASNLLPQIKSQKEFNYDLAMYGARQILWGLFKKIAVADVLAVFVDNAYNNPAACSGGDAIIAILFFSMQIYCDFSAYTDIAIGSAKLLGINLMTNFKSPYFSLSVREFWSRWHISLSTWFKDYLYIPLGGNKCSKLKNYRNLFVTFLASGLWHGANWTFVVWGGMHGLIQIVERGFNFDKLKQKRIFKLLLWIVVFAFCNFAWIFFRANSFNDAWTIIQRTYAGFPDITYYIHTNVGNSARDCIIAMGMVFLVGLFDYFSLKCDVIGEMTNLKGIKKIMGIITEYLLIVLIIYFIEKGINTNQFVYFQF